jgi:hypothetical protein
MSATIAEIPRIVTDIQTNHAVFQRPRRITLDTAYPLGGYSPSQPYTVLGATVFSKNAEAQKYQIDFNQSTGKFVVREPVAPLIVEEVVAVASNVGTLGKVPAYILAVEVTAGGVTGAFRTIPVGETPTTTMVAVDFTTGGLTFLAGDAVTSVRVTYIPLGVGPFVEANRVVDEAVVFGSGAGDTFNLANRAALIQHVWNDTASAASRLPTIVPVGEAPGSNEIAIDINNSGATTITNNSGQDTNVGKVTYWKYSAFVAHGWTDQADIAATSNAIVIGEVLDLGGILIPGFGDVLVGEATATNKQQRLLGPSGTVGTNLAVYNPAKGTITFDAGDSITTCEIPFVVLCSGLLSRPLAEVPVGRDLSGVSFDAMLYMRRS